jgi:hypothetical protein
MRISAPSFLPIKAYLGGWAAYELEEKNNLVAFNINVRRIFNENRIKSMLSMH